MPKKTTSKKPAPPAHVPTIQFVDCPPTEEQLASSKAVQIGVIDYPVTSASPITARDQRPWTGPTTQAAIAAKFKIKARTVRRWANGETKGPVEVKKQGSMFYHRPWPD